MASISNSTIHKTLLPLSSVPPPHVTDQTRPSSLENSLSLMKRTICTALAEAGFNPFYNRTKMEIILPNTKQATQELFEKVNSCLSKFNSKNFILSKVDGSNITIQLAGKQQTQPSLQVSSSASTSSSNASSVDSSSSSSFSWSSSSITSASPRLMLLQDLESLGVDFTVSLHDLTGKLECGETVALYFYTSLKDFHEHFESFERFLFDEERYTGRHQRTLSIFYCNTLIQKAKDYYKEDECALTISDITENGSKIGLTIKLTNPSASYPFEE